nr:MAG TPA: hypothetical protein [Caudoviricetes sp.]
MGLHELLIPILSLFQTVRRSISQSITEEMVADQEI